ncbi:hypothetical protein CH92_10560 [Stutzerimonas stutzeri]|uniref:Uncharacterized protein n=1 Tax=Stutzerimonas stutzeri TaxID=316 RepID=W8R3Z5_STUST|nr:hypothetical protein [Stutzerimonas stutzeri]AHL77645.1 hypothetical protein CH92_10560 [Stutzerimonas stutzeri]MCQ4327906.1 hypothetical protein [Stutzerimonas stutzeri]
MNGEKLITAEHGACAMWDSGAASAGCNSSTHSRLRDSDQEWEANYLLPQLVIGAEYPTHATKTTASIWFKRHFSW